MFVVALLAGCKKFLEEKPNKILAVASTIQDYQALMDKYNVLNSGDAASGDASAGETYLTDADFNARAQEDQRLYTWENSSVFPLQVNDWFYCYRNVYYANTVIEGLPKVGRPTVNGADWDNVLGQGYYTRARSFLQALGTWSLVLKGNEDGPGIPLRLNTNFNEVSERAGISKCYQQVIEDLKRAAALLPKQPYHVMRASKPAAYALLARTYLWIGNYEQAGLYADSCLQIKSTLLDYNSLTANASFPIGQFNTEVIFSSKLNGSPSLTSSRAKIIPALYALFDAKDLRKVVYFKDNGNGSFAFKGSYDGSSSAFSGIAIDEVYLTRSECSARAGKLSDALSDLNILLAARYLKGSFTPYSSSDQQAVLQLILTERRKELINRGIRWMDIKRLNAEGAGIGLARTVTGLTYTLPANSRRFALPIPEDVVSLSNIAQNKY